MSLCVRSWMEVREKRNGREDVRVWEGFSFFLVSLRYGAEPRKELESFWGF